MFQKILIANRGEIAIRVARTAKQMGISTVAVYSDADNGAPHMRYCDEAIHIGPAAAADSYLRADKIIKACKATGADGVHPGYGFLSENAAFADQLAKENIVFIGPTAKTIRAMGSKSAAKDLMEAAGVPTTPGYQGEDQSVNTFKREAKRIGYPVLLKATAGGGGKGMRLVSSPDDLESALISAQREAKSAFGDDRFLIEKYIERARHVEVQIFGDGAGNVVHMFERDCSVQRRHQKVIEEAPAPNLPARVRKALLKAGVDAGIAVKYRGAGTVEFLYDGADAVYFMEMNTRLQVEHPVSEAITGLDFVEWQLRIAAGEELPLTQDNITETGHAFEARLYAENPDDGFAPSIGTLSTLSLTSDHARIDSGVEEGQTITPFYDPMIAKIITHGANREAALGRLRDALAHTRVAGLDTNASFLFQIASTNTFISGDFSTRFIDDHEATLFGQDRERENALIAALLGRQARKYLGDDPWPFLDDPWNSLPGFRANRPTRNNYWIEIDSKPAAVKLETVGDNITIAIENNTSADARRKNETRPAPKILKLQNATANGMEYRFSRDGIVTNAHVADHLDGVRVWISAQHYDFTFSDPRHGAAGQQSSEGSLTAPMPGVVTLLSADIGAKVKAGEPLLVMEAMKMEHAIKAPFDGTIIGYKFAPGDQVKDGDLLVEFEEASA